MQVSLLPAASAVAPRPLMHVYNNDWLRAMLPSGRCRGQMFCAEDSLPQAILTSELLAPTPAAACLHVVPLRFSERSQGKWQGEPRRVYLNESRTMVEGIVQRTPWYNASGGRDHIWILAYSNPKPPAEFVKGVLWLTNGDPRWISRLANDDPVGSAAEAAAKSDTSLVARTVIIPPAIPPQMVRYWSRQRGSTRPQRNLLASFYGNSGATKSPVDHGYSDRRAVAVRYAVNISVADTPAANATPGTRIWALSPATAGALSEAELYARSRFVLCPRGLALWTPRPILAVYSGAVPVIIGADELLLPLYRMFDWRTFAVRVPSLAIGHLVPLLRAIPRAHVRALLANASKLRALLQAEPQRLAEAIVEETLQIDTPEVRRCHGRKRAAKSRSSLV